VRLQNENATERRFLRLVRAVRSGEQPPVTIKG
jgi:hypothetical protein